MLPTRGKSSHKTDQVIGGSRNHQVDDISVQTLNKVTPGKMASPQKVSVLSKQAVVSPLLVREVPLRKAKFVKSSGIPESSLGSPTFTSVQKLDIYTYCSDLQVGMTAQKPDLSLSVCLSNILNLMQLLRWLSKVAAVFWNASAESL